MIPTCYLRQVPIVRPWSVVTDECRLKLQQWWSLDKHTHLAPNEGGDGEWRDVLIADKP